MPGLTGVAHGRPDDAGHSAASTAGTAQAADGSPSMAETRKWLRHAGNSSLRFAGTGHFAVDHLSSFLILIAGFVTL
jgi:hypothetical protein